MTSNAQYLSAGRVMTDCSMEGVQDDVITQGQRGYMYVVTYVTHPRCCIDAKKLAAKAKQMCGGTTKDGLLPDQVVKKLLPPMGVPDVVLSPDFWHSYVVGRISPWIDPDSDDPYIRRLSEKALVDELRYFSYLNLDYVTVQLRGVKHGNLARIFTRHLEDKSCHHFIVWAIVPLCSSAQNMINGSCPPSIPNSDYGSMNGEISSHDSDPECSSLNTSSSSTSSNETWQWYYDFRAACNNDFQIAVCLELTPDVQDIRNVAMERWRGEQVHAIMINTRMFLAEPRTGLPVLSIAHEKLVKNLFGLKLNAVVDGPELHHRSPATNHSPESLSRQPLEGDPPFCVYFEYLNKLWEARPHAKSISPWARGYEDHLQMPLQPLGDNLEAQIYETFELDPVKYVDYRSAIDQAVGSKCRDLNEGDTLVLMVLGAGRGPLVTAAYTVLKKQCVTSFKLYAVEKNQNAVLTLKKKRATEWHNEVEVVSSDMRRFTPPEKADIVISELLGSFGDNELSPECLDGALHLMKDTCVSIPESYTSYIGPIHSHRLFDAIRGVQDRDVRRKGSAFETSYVVRVHNYFEIAPPQDLFTFSHPNFKLLSNDRYKELVFVARDTSELMGFVGYFTTVLSDGISLSILPRCHTEGLVSWFPILFPIQEPVLVEKGRRVRLRFWRCSNEKTVWYEWQLVEPKLLPIANSAGQSCSVRLQ